MICAVERVRERFLDEDVCAAFSGLKRLWNMEGARGAYEDDVGLEGFEGAVLVRFRFDLQRLLRRRASRFVRIDNHHVSRTAIEEILRMARADRSAAEDEDAVRHHAA
jgi:hypothetical protein